MNKRDLLVPRIGVAALSSPLEIGVERAPKIAADLADILKKNGCEVLEFGVVDTPEKSTSVGCQLAESHVDAVVFAAACWFEDYLVLDLLEECTVPTLLWALPGMETGALCGVQQLTAYLKQLENPCSSVFGELEDAKCLKKTLSFLRGTALKSRLRRCRVGMLGHHANGMTDTSPNEFLLKKIIGPRVFWLDLPDILAQVANMPEAKVEKLWKEVRSRAGACKVTNADGLDSMRAYTVLKEIIDKEGLHAISIGCYPHLMGRICLAASLLADENIPIACEGDVHGAIGQIMLQLLTGQATHNTDWLDPVDAESVVFTHCGSGSFSLAEKQNDIRLAPVRLMNQGACALFTAKPGPVTLVNITAHLNGYQCAVLEGEAIPTEMVFPGNPVRVRFDEPVETLLDWIHDTGLGHHWMIGYGHVAAEIQAWSKIVSENMKFMSR